MESGKITFKEFFNIRQIFDYATCLIIGLPWLMASWSGLRNFFGCQDDKLIHTWIKMDSFCTYARSVAKSSSATFFLYASSVSIFWNLLIAILLLSKKFTGQWIHQYLTWACNLIKAFSALACSSMSTPFGVFKDFRNPTAKLFRMLAEFLTTCWILFGLGLSFLNQ